MPTEEEAARRREYNRHYYKLNVERIRAKSAGRKLEKAKTTREARIQSLYRIGSGDYDRILAEQGGVCAICGNPETKKFKGNVTLLSIDHNHATGLVRGLLCFACNVGVGFLGDCKARLQAAIVYLEKYDD